MCHGEQKQGGLCQRAEETLGCRHQRVKRISALCDFIKSFFHHIVSEKGASKRS